LSSVGRPAAGLGAKRLFFKEIKPGDLRKLEGQSNDSPTGGGARDLRFPDEPFRPLFEKYFPTPRALGDGRTVQQGRVFWRAGGNERSAEVEYWPPTDARQGEGRIARINDLAALRNPPKGDAVVLLLIHDDRDRVWPRYVTRQQLASPEFDRRVGAFIVECLDRPRGHESAYGWIDFEEDANYCHSRPGKSARSARATPRRKARRG
jgi:hypothetical protein